MAGFDPRLTPARGDIAAAHLDGQVEARRFVEGARFQIAAAHAALRQAPDERAEQVNQGLFGETFMVYDQSNGWAWGQMEGDGYVGWMALAALSPAVIETTHRVCVLRTFLFERPDLKAPPLMAVSMNARLAVGEMDGAFTRVAGSGWIFSGHAAPLGQFEDDFVAVAERFLGTPYLWGGRDSIGIDCSGLVQTALAAAGVFVRRDCDMQSGLVGDVVDAGSDFAHLQRGDLIYWSGHVAIMLDATRVIHANHRRHMAVGIETLADAIERIQPVWGEVLCVRRIGRG